MVFGDQIPAGGVHQAVDTRGLLDREGAGVEDIDDVFERVIVGLFERKSGRVKRRRSVRVEILQEDVKRLAVRRLRGGDA